jgi:hypothetical protein
VAYPGIFLWGVYKLSLGQGRYNGVLGLVVPWSGVLLNLRMGETRILIRLLGIYFSQNWEFGWALAKLLEFREGGAVLNTPTPPLGMPLMPTLVYQATCWMYLFNLSHVILSCFPCYSLFPFCYSCNMVYTLDNLKENISLFKSSCNTADTWWNCEMEWTS